MSIADGAAARWGTVVDHTGAPVATAVAALMVAVTVLQYVVLPAAGVPADGTLQHRLFHFDTSHPARLWTLATSVFAHGGFLHLAVNVQLVVGFGSVIEPRDGGEPFIAGFVAGVIGALVAGVVLQASLGGVGDYVGASGGAFGLLGWLAGYDPRRDLPTIPPGPAWIVAAVAGGGSLAVVAVYGVSAFGIAHVPHVGALLAGAVVGRFSR